MNDIKNPQEPSGCLNTLGTLFCLSLIVMIILTCVYGCNIFQLNRQLSKLKTSKDELLKENSILQNKISEFRKKEKQINTQKHNIKKTLQSLKNQKKELSEKIIKLNDQNKTLSSNNEELTSNCKNLQLKYQSTYKLFVKYKKTHNYKKIVGYYIEIKIAKLSNKQVKIYGDSNFPPGTKFELFLEEQIGTYFPVKITTFFNILADQSWEIQSPLGGEKGLLPGVYHITIKTIDPSKQPKDVIKVLGLYGDNLIGNSIFGIGNKLYFKHSTTFTIGDENAKEKQIKRHQLQDNIYSEIRTMMCHQLEALLLFKDNYDFKHYGFGRGGKYHYWLKKSENIRTIVEKHKFLPTDIKIAISNLITIAFDFASGKEKETTKILLKNICNTIKYNKHIQFNEQISRNLTLQLKEKNNANKRKITKDDYRKIYNGMSLGALQNILKNIKDVVIIADSNYIVHGNGFIIYMLVEKNKLKSKGIKYEDMSIQEFYEITKKLSEQYD